MPDDNGHIAIVEARCEASGFLKTRALRKVDPTTVEEFVKEEIIAVFGLPQMIRADGGS